MRIDKMLANVGYGSRKEVKKILRRWKCHSQRKNSERR